MELSKTYTPSEVEQTVYEKWISANAFHANPADTKPSFCMVIPPPNVTAALHLGHALNNTLQDVLTRFRRMQQHATLWMPGTDHAGIATQTVVEKRILAEEGKRRTDFEREDFVSRVQAWKDEYETRILGQLQQMGCSCDWDRTRFTMDDTCAKAVRETFFRLFKDGLIYRGKRLVNWDPATQTVLADDEVEHQDVRGHFWYLQYPLVEPAEIDGKTLTHVTVATTRPETMLGDTAVAMNPGDPRAKALVGKMVSLPLVGRKIPIIADLHVVMPNPDSDDEKAKFSTGFLKVTPAHDPDDYQIGLRHDLPMINIMALDASISKNHGWDDWDTLPAANQTMLEEWVLGKDRFEARDAIVDFFQQEKLLEDVRDHTHPVGHSYRSHVPIEPYLSDQWYVAVKKPIAGREDLGLIEGTDVPVNSLAGLALTPLLDGRLKFTPDRYAKTYQTWLENLRDWPISRQLWWGHQIPVWFAFPSTASSSAPYAKDTDDHNRLSGVLKEFVVSCGFSEDDISCIEPSYDSESPEPFIPDGYITWPLLLCANNPQVDEALSLLKTYKESDNDAKRSVIQEIKTKFGQTAVEQLNQTSTAIGLSGQGKPTIYRDPDVLDTWFSSGLWPFSTLGWPDKTPELDKFYPGNVLSTAREIITLWVSRMVMMGQYCVGDIPFTEVFIHAMIQDGKGRKMSKSLGNGVDPADIIDSHGADAMRYTLVSMTTQTQDVRMPLSPMKLPDGRMVNSSPKFDLGRNLCNKLWNASRFVLTHLLRAPKWDTIQPQEDLSDAWILSRLHTTIRDATAALDAYRFNELTEKLYHFLWDDFCDWYVEIAKVRIAEGDRTPRAILAHVLDGILRLLHPIMPFVTEAIWEKLNQVVPTRGPGDTAAEPMLINAQWPLADGETINPGIEGEFHTLAQLIRQIRNIRMQHNVVPSRKVDVLIETIEGLPTTELVQDQKATLCALAGIGEMTIHFDPITPPQQAASLSINGLKLYVLDIVDREAELARLKKQQETLTRGVRSAAGKLGNENFVANAPADVVKRERERLEEMQRELDTTNQALAALGE